MADIIAYGFGTYLDELKWRTDWPETLLKALPETIRKDFEAEWEDNKEDFDGVKEEFFEDYVDAYEDYAGFSTEGFLADCINVSEFDEKHIVSGTDLTLYAQPRFPETKEETFPTKNEILKAMEKWLGYVSTNAEALDYRYDYWHEL